MPVRARAGRRARTRGGKMAVEERFFVEGGNRLYGEVRVSGAKNAALKMIAAALLAPGRTTLRNVPRIRDVETMLAVLDGLGVETRFEGNTLTVDRSEEHTSELQSRQYLVCRLLLEKKKKL